MANPWIEGPKRPVNTLPSIIPPLKNTGDTCSDCGRPVFYDSVKEDYRHVQEPWIGCFLIEAELVSADYPSSANSAPWPLSEDPLINILRASAIIHSEVERYLREKKT